MSWFAKSKSAGSREASATSEKPALKPSRRDADQVLLSARNLEKEGHLGAALQLLNNAIGCRPDDVELWLARGSIYYTWSRFQEAYRAYRDAIGIFPDNVDLIARFGWTAHALGNAGEAEVCMRRVVEMRPNEADAHFGLGVTLQSMKRHELAIESFRAAIERDPTATHAFTNLGVCLMDLGRFADAEGPLRKAIDLMPENPGAWVNLGVDLYRQGKAGVEEAYQNAQRLENATGECVDAFVSYTTYLRNAGRVSEAIAMYNEYLPGHPNTAGLTQLGMCLLDVGEFELGWSLYEFRWLQEPLVSLRANLDKPVWQGQDIRGKTILVRAEQGVGDVVQFARYLAWVKRLGATVLLQGRDGMEELSSRFVGVDQVINSGEVFPDFQYYTNLMSLPRFFGNDPKLHAPCAPYVRIDEVGSARFREQLAPEMLNIGLVWAGNPTHLLDKSRSMPLSMFQDLAKLPDVRIYSLQKGEAAKQLADAGSDSKIVDWAPQLNHFGDTADAIAALDVVLSVDTSVAHLAGALGKPVWVLLPTPAEWRWMDGRTHSDWYSSARLFRQSVQGDWSNVIDDVKCAVVAWTRDRRAVASENLNQVNDQSLESAQAPSYIPITVPPGLTAIGEMREGIFQYFPDRDIDEGIALRWYGEWHHDQLALLARLVKLGQTIVEIGGGVGVHTVALSRLVGPRGHIIVYENDKGTKPVLLQNLKSNKARNVTVMLNPSRSAARSNLAADFESIDDLELRELDWLKVNSSNDTLAVIDGSEATIWRTRPKMFLNVEDRYGDIAHKMAAMGYACWLHRSNIFRKQNFNNVDLPIAQHRTQYAILAIPEEVDVDIELGDCVPLNSAE